MKRIILIIIVFFITLEIYAQFDEVCYPDKLMVAAENLNFRTKPDTNSTIISQLDNGELLTLLEVHDRKENYYRYFFYGSWIKVLRNQTGETGYVFGKYVRTPEMAYLNYHDTDRIQNGNWYGISQERGKVKIEKSIPKITTDAEFSVITGSKPEHIILVCTQSEIKEGEILGRLFESHTEYLKIGTQIELITIGNFEFSLVCTGEVQLNPPYLTRKNEKVIFLTTEINGSKRQYLQQDLSGCLYQVGDVGYQIHYAGDLNNDGIPELILSEETNIGGWVYYFRSNAEGKLELASITGISSKC